MAANCPSPHKWGLSITRYRRNGRPERYAGLMVKFLIGLVTGIALVFLSVILLFVIALRFRETPPTLAANSVLILRLSGELPEKPPIELPSIVADNRTPLTVIGVWSALEKAAADGRIKAVVLQPEGLSAGWGKLPEMRFRIHQLNKAGKSPVGLFSHSCTPACYVAFAA